MGEECESRRETLTVNMVLIFSGKCFRKKSDAMFLAETSK